MGLHAGIESMDLPGRAGRLGDAQDRPRADGVPRNGPRADAGVHPAARFGVPIRGEEGKIGADGTQSVRIEGGLGGGDCQEGDRGVGAVL